MGVFRKGLVYLFRDFSCWTSTHGIPHIGMANAIWLRLFWILVVLACLIGFLIQLKMLIQKYFSYQVNTETQLLFSERVFPAVTICHLNPWKADSLGGSKYMQDLVAAYNSSVANTNFGFDDGRTGERQQRAVKLAAMANQELFGDTPNPEYTYDDIVISCTYNAIPCNETDFAQTQDPNFGLCQEFNYNSVYKSSRAGPLYGLRVVMMTDQANYLPWTEASGVVVSIHDAADPPYPDVLGYYAPPGTASSMGVRFVSTTREGPPYGTCTSAGYVTMEHYSGKYEVEACFRNCLQVHIIENCGCYDPTYSFNNKTSSSSCYQGATAETATSNNLDCIEGIENSDGTSGFNLITDCNCPQPCKVDTYSVTVSTAQWPSDAYTPSACTQSNQTGAPWLANPTDPANEALCLSWYKTNTLLVEIYYERMNYQVLTESPAYTVVNLVSDIGGQVGLFLGMSIISVIELFTLVLLLIWYCTTHKQRRLELEGVEDTAKQEQENTKNLSQLNKKNPAQNKPIYDHGKDDVVPPAVHD